MFLRFQVVKPNIVLNNFDDASYITPQNYLGQYCVKPSNVQIMVQTGPTFRLPWTTPYKTNMIMLVISDQQIFTVDGGEFMSKV